METGNTYIVVQTRDGHWTEVCRLTGSLDHMRSDVMQPQQIKFRMETPELYWELPGDMVPVAGELGSDPDAALDDEQAQETDAEPTIAISGVRVHVYPDRPGVPRVVVGIRHNDEWTEVISQTIDDDRGGFVMKRHTQDLRVLVKRAASARSPSPLPKLTT